MENENLAFLITDLCVSLYTELVDTDKPCFSPSLQSLLHSDALSLLQKTRSLYDRLLKTKSSMQEVEFYSQFSENEGYQKALQKLDSEIRNHIKHELQMKVFIDNLDEKLLKAGKTPGIALESQENLERLSVNFKSNQLEELKKSLSSNDEREVFSLKERNFKEAVKIAEIEKETLKIKQKCAQVKIELDFVNNEYERQKNEFLRLKSLLRNSDLAKVSSIDKEEIKEIDEKTVRISKTPNKAETSVSPIRSNYKNIANRQTGLTKSTNKLEKNPFLKTLKKEMNKSKTKPKLQVIRK
jgi:vacuolar-type H+-ATPase subunit I/STV1